MLFNAEFRRNIWLDFTFHRVVLTPIFVILVAYLFYLTSNTSNAATIAFQLGCFFIFLWGTKKSSETVIEEVNNNTWDFQRQSSISPWDMTWGKLLGSTSFSWYGAFVCLLIYSIMRGRYLPETSLTLSQEILLLVLGGLFGQSVALLFSLQLLPQIRRLRTNKTFRYFVGGFFVGAFSTLSSFHALKAYHQQISWHHYNFNTGSFALTSLILFLGWSIIGLQRSFCKELQYQNIPWIWAAFNIFCMVYFSGLITFQNLSQGNIHIPELKDIQQHFINAPLYTAFFIAQGLTYFALFTDELSFIRYQHFFSRIREHNIKESLQQLPWWTISLLCTFIAGSIAIMQQKQESEVLEHFSLTIFIITTILFLLRDIGLIHYFNLGKNPQRAMGTSFLYLFMLYFIFPMILSASHQNDMIPLFLPSWGQNTLLAFLSTTAQIIFFAALCKKRWQENMAPRKHKSKT